ncbi:hypothetical protein MRX96_014292 [Rhipicephalus microplus]
MKRFVVARVGSRPCSFRCWVGFSGVIDTRRGPFPPAPWPLPDPGPTIRTARRPPNGWPGSFSCLCGFAPLEDGGWCSMKRGAPSPRGRPRRRRRLLGGLRNYGRPAGPC